MSKEREPWLLLGVPVGDAKRVMRDVNARVARFERSRHAFGVTAGAAHVAVHSLLLWQRERRTRLDAWWAEFDASEYLGWLAAQSLLHPSAVPDVYRAWRRVLDWLVGEGAMSAARAEEIFQDLCDLEDAFLHLVIDGWLTFWIHAERLAS